MGKQSEEGFGTLVKGKDGRTFVHFERPLPYPVEFVWTALTEQDQLDVWMPGVRFERRQGGHFEIRFGGECEGPAHVHGVVEAYVPPLVLQLGTIRWALSATPEGCLLIFSDVLVFEPPRSEREIANAVLGGWHNYLDMLEDALAGRTVDPTQPEPDYDIREVPGRSNQGHGG